MAIPTSRMEVLSCCFISFIFPPPVNKVMWGIPRKFEKRGTIEEVFKFLALGLGLASVANASIASYELVVATDPQTPGSSTIR